MWHASSTEIKKPLTCTLKEHSAEGSGCLFLAFWVHKAFEQWNQKPGGNKNLETLII